MSQVEAEVREQPEALSRLPNEGRETVEGVAVVRAPGPR